MARSNASGLTPTAADVPVIMGMVARGDREHDIAAWFGFNQGRIKQAKDGKYGPAAVQPGIALPPKGPPGPKGSRLRNATGALLAKLQAGDQAGFEKALADAIADYDKTDP